MHPEHPIKLVVEDDLQRNRLTVFFRLLLALPALLFATAFGGSLRVPASGRGSYSSGVSGGALGFAVGLLGWFASLVQGRMPKGLRDAGAYSVGYSAQVLAYLLLVTDRYPSADPTALLGTVERPPVHPVHLFGEAHDLRRSRVLVFFRLPLAIPHVVWLTLWTVVAVLVGIVNWFATLIVGRPPAPLHGFLSRYVRYTLHVYAFVYLAANP